MESLSEPTAQGVDRPEVGPVVGRADRADELSQLVDREDIGKSLLPADPEHLERRPIARVGVGVEELDDTVGDAEGGGRELAVILEMEEVLADLLFGESIWRDVEVVGQLPDGAKIGLLSAFAQTGELESLGHALM